MDYTADDLVEALRQREHGQVVYRGLRLGRPWADLVEDDSYLLGLEVTVVLSLEDDQPYLVSEAIYGNIETPLDMQHAYKRKVLELLRRGRSVVRAPYRRGIGSTDITEIQLKDTESKYDLLDLMLECKQLTIAEGVDIQYRGDYVVLMSCGLDSSSWIVDWAVENLGAEVDTRFLKLELDKLNSLREFSDKYLPKDPVA